MQAFQGKFTHLIKITFEKPELFDAKFFEEFSSMIHPTETLNELAIHITHNYGYNLEDKFIEGIGDLKEMGIKIEEIDQESEVEVLD